MSSTSLLVALLLVVGTFSMRLEGVEKNNNIIAGIEQLYEVVKMITQESGQGSDSGKTVHLKEGAVTSIRIEVAADGGRTIKNYFIHVTRLSFSNASLSAVELSAVSDLYSKFAANVAR
ncbi:uncharacterized protein [Acropora muricata]|uniref:uncharacterized protein n=1 Tax=Acropora muricata TaxID=159855 RepID=UPI0034E3B57B